MSTHSQSQPNPLKRSRPDSGSSGFNDINSFLLDLDRDTFDKLFSEPASCLAIFRLMVPLAKQLVMSTLFIDEKLPLATVNSWFLPSAQTEVKLALQNAMRLNVFTIYKESKEQTKDGVIIQGNFNSLVMNDKFKASFKDALLGSGYEGCFGKYDDSVDKHAKSKSFIDAKAESKREEILHFMVGSISNSAPSKKVKNLLVKSGLMAISNDHDKKVKITNTGFQFLLKDTASQTWIFLLQYLRVNCLKDEPTKLVEVLNFYFMLCALEPGQDYSVKDLTEFQKSAVIDLADYGLVYQRKPGSRRFYPTRLATMLMSGEADNETSAPQASAPPQDPDAPDLGLEHVPGTLIVETNYRVYAYTSSPLQIAILNLFMSSKARFPNMVVGYLDRESIRKAISHGITADQIVHYLEAHAHPQMARNTPVIPITVVDQIRLWELEKERVKPTPGRLWRGFARQQDFNAILSQAQRLNGVLVANSKRMLLVVSNRIHADLKAYSARITGSSNGNPAQS